MSDAPVNARAVNDAAAPVAPAPPAFKPAPPAVSVPVASPFDAVKAGTAGTFSFTPALPVPGTPRSLVYRDAALIGSSHATRRDGVTTQLVVLKLTS